MWWTSRAVVLAALIQLAQMSVGHAQADFDPNRTLRGIKVVGVAPSIQISERAANVLDSAALGQRLTTVLELELRRSGVRVADGVLCPANACPDGAALLTASVLVLNTRFGYVVSYELQVHQPGALTGGYRGLLGTWERNGVFSLAEGAGRLDEEIVKAMRDPLEDFINVLLAQRA
jgi:hypothetical protein